MPVNKEALFALGIAEQQIKLLSDLGCLEIIYQEVPLYRLASLLFGWVDSTNCERYSQHIETASNYAYEQWIDNTNTISEKYQFEALRLASLCNKTDYIESITDQIAQIWIVQYRHQEVVDICQRGLMQIDSWRLHHRLAIAKQHLALVGVEDHYRRAIEFCRLQTLVSSPDLDRLEVVMNYCDYLTHTNYHTKAYRMLTQILVPAFSRIEARRELAITQGMISKILALRGDYQTALYICQNKELPIYRSLEDAESTVKTYDQILDLLLHMGKVDEAYHCLIYKVLTGFKSLGP